MEINKSNGLLKIIVPVVIVLMLFILFLSGGNENDISTTPQGSINLTDEEAKALGIAAGDTPHDTLRTLLGEVRKVKQTSEEVAIENAKLIKENADLARRANNTQLQVGEAVDERLNGIVASLQEQNRRLQEQVDELKEGITNGVSTSFSPTDEIAEQSQNPNAPTIGGGQMGLGFGSENPTTNNIQNIGSDGLVWVNPGDMVITDMQGKAVKEDYQGQTKTVFANPFKLLDDSALGRETQKFTGVENKRDEKSTATPFYTIPENSILTGSQTLTALVGRVPIQGAVTDPYPFKALIGRENLMANGIDLPDVEGAIVSGTVSGDWTLSCVRANVNSISFIFSDGRISNGRNTITANRDNSQSQSIGYLSNEFGVPCISGERKTNAPEYLTSQFLLSGSSAAAQAFAQGNTTNRVTDSGNVVSSVTGSQGQYVLGQAIGGGLNEVSQWFRERYGQTFDAIYVPTGQKVAIHISKDLYIDYDKSARKVKYTHQARNNAMD